MAELREGESLVDLQRNGLVIIQDRSRFCFGIDAVLLSGFAEVRKGETVLDLGTGTGRASPSAAYSSSSGSR